MLQNDQEIQHNTKQSLIFLNLKIVKTLAGKKVIFAVPDKMKSGHMPSTENNIVDIHEEKKNKDEDNI